MTTLTELMTQKIKAATGAQEGSGAEKMAKAISEAVAEWLATQVVTTPAGNGSITPN